MKADEIKKYIEDQIGLECEVFFKDKKALKRHKNRKLVTIPLTERFSSYSPIYNKLIRLFKFENIENVGLYSIVVYLTEDKEKAIKKYIEKSGAVAW